MKYIVLDIETSPDKELIEVFEGSVKAKKGLKDPVKVKADIATKIANGRKTMSLDQDLSEISCVGIKEVGKVAETYHVSQMPGWFKDNLRGETTLITFNGKSFDIPILIKVGIKNGYDFPYRKLSKMTGRYNTDSHIDLMHTLDFNSNSYKSLNHYLQVYLGVQKETMGDEFFATATQEEIEQHCMDDLIYTEMLFEKFRDMINI